MRNHRGQPARVSDRIYVRLLAKLVQLSQELHQNFLINVIGLGLLGSVMRAEMEFVANDTFDQRLGVYTDKSRDELVGLFVAGRRQ